MLNHLDHRKEKIPPRLARVETDFLTESASIKFVLSPPESGGLGLSRSQVCQKSGRLENGISKSAIVCLNSGGLRRATAYEPFPYCFFFFFFCLLFFFCVKEWARYGLIFEEKIGVVSNPVPHGLLCTADRTKKFGLCALKTVQKKKKNEFHILSKEKTHTKSISTYA